MRKITGNDELAFKDEDLEEDFDPDKYDQRMAEVFEQYDNAPFQPEDEEKPVFSDMDSDLEPDNWDEYGDDEDEQENQEGIFTHYSKSQIFVQKFNFEKNPDIFTSFPSKFF